MRPHFSRRRLLRRRARYRADAGRHRSLRPRLRRRRDCGRRVAAAALGMSTIMFCGAAQIVAAQLLAAGAPLAVILLSCFVVGLRFLMYSAAMAPYLRRARSSLAAGARVPAHRPGVRRGAAALPIRRRSARQRVVLPRQRRAAVDRLAGRERWSAYFAGNVIPASWSLDFAVPLCFLALLAPLLRDRISMLVSRSRRCRGVALDALPMRLILICAGLLGDRRGQCSATRGQRMNRDADALARDLSPSARSTTCAAVVHRACSRAASMPPLLARGAEARPGGDADGDRRADDRVHAGRGPASIPAIAKLVAALVAGVVAWWRQSAADHRRRHGRALVAAVRQWAKIAAGTQEPRCASKAPTPTSPPPTSCSRSTRRSRWSGRCWSRASPAPARRCSPRRCARAVGRPLLQWHIKSTTKAQQGLYEYDAVSRLRDSQLGDEHVADIAHYIKRGVLWEAFERRRPRSC